MEPGVMKSSLKHIDRCPGMQKCLQGPVRIRADRQTPHAITHAGRHAGRQGKFNACRFGLQQSLDDAVKDGCRTELQRPAASCDQHGPLQVQIDLDRWREVKSEPVQTRVTIFQLHGQEMFGCC